MSFVAMGWGVAAVVTVVAVAWVATVHWMARRLIRGRQTDRYPYNSYRFPVDAGLRIGREGAGTSNHGLGRTTEIRSQFATGGHIQFTQVSPLAPSDAQKAANNRAWALLEEHLTTEQWEQLHRRGYFFVETKSGRTYAIWQGTVSNVTSVENGLPARTHCVNFGGWGGGMEVTNPAHVGGKVEHKVAVLQAIC